MYCPACDKEFSPVHSRCPECKGWLRVSGPTVGAKSANGSSIRTAAPSAMNLDTATTQKVQPVTAANVPLPSRPKPGGNPGRGPGIAAGPGQEWGSPEPAPPRPAPSLQTSTEMVEAAGGRGALGSGWESANSFAAPAPAATGWGTPAPPPAGPASGAGWGTAVGGLGNAWQSPQAEPPKTGGWGSSAAVPLDHSNGLGSAPGGFGGPQGPSSPGLGGGPPSGNLGGPTGALGAAPAGGGGWLGDGGHGGAYAAPSSQGGGWLGDSSAGGSPQAPTPISMPAMAPPEMVGLDTPALALPDHTVAVDLGTPWEEEGQVPASNKMIYLVLACLVLSLTGFSGYVWWQNKKLKEPTQKAVPVVTTGSRDVGMDYLKKGQAAFQQRRYEDAQSNGELAFTLIADLQVATPAERDAVKKFHRQATLRFAQSLFDQAQAASRTKDTNQAIALCHQSGGMYRKLSGTEKQQAQALALEARIYESVGDYAGAISAYKKAATLNPSADYGAAARRVRSVSAPAPAQSNQPVSTEPIEQPSVGGPAQYPSGRPGSGHYSSHPSNPAPAAQPVGPAPKPRPVNTYVPPKRDTTPSWRKRGSDVLPGY